MNGKIKRYLLITLTGVSWSILLCVGLTLLYFGCRVFICDQFIIPSGSMLPTLISGDRILCNKVIFGARIYKSFDFADRRPLESWRMPGLRKIRPNDILVFNVPDGYNRGTIEFKINYVYAKRCIGTPGDTVWIENGFYRNNHFSGIIGQELEQRYLAAIPDSLISRPVLISLPFDGRWTIKSFGPLYVPAAGDTLRLEPVMYPIYKKIIEYESGSNLTMDRGQFRLDNAPLSEYVVRENYYFTGGDNVRNSGDSRYWGFVPEEFIIGIAKRILYARSQQTGQFRWDRLWRKIDND